MDWLALIIGLILGLAIEFQTNLFRNFVEWRKKQDEKKKNTAHLQETTIVENTGGKRQ